MPPRCSLLASRRRPRRPPCVAPAAAVVARRGGAGARRWRSRIRRRSRRRRPSAAPRQQRRSAPGDRFMGSPVVGAVERRCHGLEPPAELCARLVEMAVEDSSIQGPGAGAPALAAQRGDLRATGRGWSVRWLAAAHESPSGRRAAGRGAGEARPAGEQRREPVVADPASCAAARAAIAAARARRARPSSALDVARRLLVRVAGAPCASTASSSRPTAVNAARPRGAACAAAAACSSLAPRRAWRVRAISRARAPWSRIPSGRGRPRAAGRRRSASCRSRWSKSTIASVSSGVW